MGGFAFAQIFGDGMVLQRDKELMIWGTSDREGTVQVQLGGLWAESTVSDGRWKCALPPMKTACGLTLLAKQDDRIIQLENVMVGDVWLAGGQSNMEFFLRYEKHWKEARSLPKNRLIRMYTCPRIAFDGQAPFQSGVGCWFGEGDSAWETFASAAYWFARELQPELGIPVGIISCNWGGTSASAWIPMESLVQSPLDIYLKDYDSAAAAMPVEEMYRASMRGWALQRDPTHLQEWARVMHGISREAQLERIVRRAGDPVIPMGPYNKNRPGCLFEHMVLPISGFAIKGVLWYQGENDVHHAPLYGRLFSTLIREWRNLWGEELPFLFAQLAPFDRWLALDGEAFPEIRRQQELVSRSVKKCWMISTSDVGMRFDIHPKEKKVLGHRFFLQAMDKICSRCCLADAPEVYEAYAGEDTIDLRFAHAGKGLRIEGNILPLFAVSQNGVKLELRSAAVCGDTLTLGIQRKKEAPLEITFAESPYYKVPLYNSAKIPANPFSITVRTGNQSEKA